MDGEGALRWIWIWMAVDESRILLQSDWNGYGFLVAMDESIRMERVDVMWCRLGISFGLSLEFWNSFNSNRVCKFLILRRTAT